MHLEITHLEITIYTVKVPALWIANLATSERSAIRSGILSHGEHAVDLILVQGAITGSELIDSFENIARQLCSGIANGKLEINEKIDGSPSIVLGYDQNDQAFVAYKGGLTRKSKQLLFRSQEDVFEAFKKPEDPRRALYIGLVEHVLPQMNAVKEQYKDFIFQADLLFSANADRKKVEAKSISISSNTITYTIQSNDPLFNHLSKAEVAFVGHTIARREIAPSTQRVNAASLVDAENLSGFLKHITSEKLLALDPFQTAIIQGREQATELEDILQNKIALIRQHFAVVSPEFRQLWGESLLAAFRVFNNSTLHPGATGGIFTKAVKNRLLSTRAFISSFYQKFSKPYKRLPKGDPKRAEYARVLKAISHVKKVFPNDFEALLKAYYQAISLQAEIDKVLKSSIKSKLGGGPVEGIMLSTGDIIVKWIDRLDFTRKNNERWRSGDDARWRELAVLPEPFNIWKPGCVVMPMKLQPPHLGHIEMIKNVIAAHPGKEIIILASDKEANLDADSCKDLGLAPTKKKLRAKEFTHPFSIEIRRRLLVKALGEKVTITVVSPSILRDYLRRAKETGLKESITLAIGEKERNAGTYEGDLKTYAKLLKPYYVPAQCQGINATSVRLALQKSIFENDPSSMSVLDLALGYIDDSEERRSLIEELKSQFLAADQAAQRVLGNTK